MTICTIYIIFAGRGLTSFDGAGSDGCCCGAAGGGGGAVASGGGGGGGGGVTAADGAAAGAFAFFVVVVIFAAAAVDEPWRVALTVAAFEVGEEGGHQREFLPADGAL